MKNDVLTIASFIKRFANIFTDSLQTSPWDLTKQAQEIVGKRISKLHDEYMIDGQVAVHRSARIEQGVILKGPAIVSENCFIGAHAYLRGGVFLDNGVSIGPGCEIKSSFLFERSALAHFNFVGDSLIGSGVNMEAGSIIANHFNERAEKEISVLMNDIVTRTGIEKFGALVGDGCKIGANAVLSPGTILEPNSVVRRLELVEQIQNLSSRS